MEQSSNNHSTEDTSNHPGFRLSKTTTPAQWHSYHHIRETEIFSQSDVIYDRNHPTMTDDQHHHFVMYKGTEIIGVLHIELPDKHFAILRSIAIKSDQQNKSYGSTLYHLAQIWILEQGREKIKLHANPKAKTFYERLGFYLEDFPDTESISSDCVDMAKDLRQ